MRRTIQYLTATWVLVAASLVGQTPPAPPPPVAPLSPLTSEIQLLTMGSRSYLGINVKEIDSNRAKELKLKEEHGVEVTQVEEDSPAGKAGMKVSDLVVEYNGQRVEGTEQFVRMVRETPVGRQVKLSVVRQGAPMTLAATIAQRSNRVFTSQRASKMAEDARKEAEKMRVKIREEMLTNMPRAYMGWSNGQLGVEAESLSDQLANYFGVKDGVLVRSVIKGSAAEKAGVKAGDVIVKVDNSKVATPKEIASQLRTSRSKKSIPLQLMRERKEMSLEVSLPDEDQGRLVQPKARTIRNTTPSNKDHSID